MFKSNHFPMNISIVGKWSHKSKKVLLVKGQLKITKLVKQQTLGFCIFIYSNPLKFQLEISRKHGVRDREILLSHNIRSVPRFSLCSPNLDTFSVLDVQLANSSCVAFGLDRSSSSRTGPLPQQGLTSTWLFCADQR